VSFSNATGLDSSIFSADCPIEEREVILSSGQKSNFYIDCKQAVLSAEGHFLVGWLFNQVIAENAPEVEAVGGLTMGADPLASAVATVSYLGARPLDAFYVRKEPKGHGTRAVVGGAASCFVPGCRSRSLRMW